MTSENLAADHGTAALRRRNRAWIVGIIAQNGPVTRGRISEITGLTGAAVSRITRELIDARLVLEGDPIAAPGRVGRREYNLTVNPDGAYVLGISITANRRIVSLANAAGAVLQTLDCNDIPIADPNRFLAEISTRAKTMVFDADFNRSRLLGAGVSAAISAGRSAQEHSSFVTSEPLGWKDVPVRQMLSEHLGMAVTVEHRASAILRGELRNLDPAEDVYLINAAFGIGNSAVLNGHLMTIGTRGFGALSHFADPASEVACKCGRVGCLEVTGSGKAVLRDLGMLEHPQAPIAEQLSTVLQRADAGDAEAKTAFATAGARMARGVDAILTLMQPDKIIFAGEVGRQADYFGGVIDALIRRGRPDPCRFIEQSTITSEQAAVSVALASYFYTGDLDLGRLNAA